MKRWLMIIVGLAVSAAALAHAMRGVNAEELLAAFRTARYVTYLPLMLLSLAAFYGLKAVRWRHLLTPQKKFSTTQLVPPLMIGFAVNNMVPAHLGEFVRVYYLHRRHGIKASTVLSTVVLERIFDVVAILILFVAGLSLAEKIDSRYETVAIVFALGAVATIAGTAFYLWRTDQFVALFDAVLARMRFVPDWLRRKLSEILHGGAEGLHSLRSGRAVLAIGANSLVQWMFNGSIAWFALLAFGVDVTPASGLIVTGVIAFAVIIPSTPGYAGVIQMAFVAGLEAQGNVAGESRIFAASVFYHLCMYIPVTLSGVFFLQREHLSLAELREASRSGNDSTDEIGRSEENHAAEGGSRREAE